MEKQQLSSEQLRDGAKAAWNKLESGANLFGEKLSSFLTSLSAPSSSSSSSSSSGQPTSPSHAAPPPASSRGPPASAFRSSRAASSAGQAQRPHSPCVGTAPGPTPPVPPRPAYAPQQQQQQQQRLRQQQEAEAEQRRRREQEEAQQILREQQQQQQQQERERLRRERERGEARGVGGREGGGARGREEEEEEGYYELLGVERDASPAVIKRAYYRMAVRYHPDKNADDPHAEAMFKRISEAYQILSDEKKRELYDKFGKSAVAMEEQGAAISMKMLFMVMFGAGKFEDTFGDIESMFDPQMLAEGSVDPQRERFEKKMEETQARLLELLQAKLRPYVCGFLKEFAEIITVEIEEKLSAPGGPSLLAHIGYLYSQEAKAHSGRWQGFVTGLQETGHYISEAASVIGDLSRMQTLQKELEKNPEIAQNEQMQQKAATLGLGLMWRLGKLQIERTVRQVCRAMFLSLPKEDRKAHINALKWLGERYQAAAKDFCNRSAVPSLTEIEEMLIRSHDYAQQKAASEEEERSRAEAVAQAQAQAQAHEDASFENSGLPPLEDINDARPAQHTDCEGLD